MGMFPSVCFSTVSAGIFVSFLFFAGWLADCPSACLRLFAVPIYTYSSYVYLYVCFSVPPTYSICLLFCLFTLSTLLTGGVRNVWKRCLLKYCFASSLIERNEMAHNEREAADSHNADSQMGPESLEVAIVTTRKSQSSENLRAEEEGRNELTDKKPRKEKKQLLASLDLEKEKREILFHEDMTLNLLSLLYTAAVTKVKFVVLVDLRLPLWSDDVPFCWTDFRSSCITTNMATFLHVFVRHSLRFSHWPAQAIGPIDKHSSNTAVEYGAGAVGHLVVFKFLR